MLFSSLSFIFRFLPIFLIAYYLCPRKGQNFVLLIGSLVFYSLGEPIYVLLMLLSIVVNFLAAKGIAEYYKYLGARRVILLLDVIYNVLVLLFFKYGVFLAGIVSSISGIEINMPHLALPLGISFYTFKILSYIIDVYNGEIDCESSIIDLGAYMCMFPQLISGPIVTYDQVIKELKAKKNMVRLSDFEDGLRIFTLGLASKVLMANRFGQIWDTVTGIGYENAATSILWIGLLSYTFQIYFDFNGYSMMAVGLGRMLGYSLPDNFNFPYIAVSVSDFWKRWHITLTDFFRKYIYIPLGGNRVGFFRMLINMLVVWLITGLWHGADWNYIIWGLYYFVFLALEKSIEKSAFGLYLRNNGLITKILGHIYAIIVIVLGWGIFAITDLSELGIFFTKLFAPAFGLSTMGMGFESFSWFMYVWLIFGAIFSTPLLWGFYKKKEKTVAGSIALFIVFWCCIIQLVNSVYNPFIYFRF